MSAEVVIREIDDDAFDRFWPSFQSIVRARDTYAYDPALDRETARALWCDVPLRTYVAHMGDAVLGTYYLKPNGAGPGGHVCNCGYMVSEAARGRGIAARMCEHSQGVARALGFRAMQFNSVVSTNEGAVRLWLRSGFSEIGRVPGGFEHPVHGYVDTLILHKHL